MGAAAASMGNTTANIMGSQVSDAQGKQRMRRKQKQTKVQGNAAMPTTQEAVALKIRQLLQESPQWSSFLDGLVDHVKASDKNLQRLLDQLQKQRESILQKALGAIQNKMSTVGDVNYRVDGKIVRDAENPAKMKIKFNPAKKRYADRAFSCFVDFDKDSKPVILFDEDAKEVMKKFRDDFASAVLGALQLLQNKELTNMDGVALAQDKVDQYLGKVEKKMKSMVAGLNMLDVKVLKSVLKSKRA